MLQILKLKEKRKKIFIYIRGKNSSFIIHFVILTNEQKLKIWIWFEKFLWNNCKKLENYYFLIDLIHFWLQLNFCLKQIIFFTNHKNNFINLNIIIYSFYNIIKIKRNKKSSKNMFKKKQKPEILKLLHCIIIFRETIICTENLRN